MTIAAMSQTNQKMNKTALDFSKPNIPPYMKKKVW